MGNVILFRGDTTRFIERNIRSLVFLQIFCRFAVTASTARFSKGPSKKSFTLQTFQYCDLTTQQRYALQEVVNIYKKVFGTLADGLRDFHKTFDKSTKCKDFFTKTE